ncbi:MAG: DMT family transporter [Chloroflexi bacterium]|nr:DMT family transporter [Chloroflexota bacterium]
MELGILLALIALVGWGTGDVFARKAMFGAKAEVVLASMIALTVVALGIATVVLEGVSAFGGHPASFYGLLVIMATLAWVTGNLFYFHGMQRAGVIIAAPILGAAPIVAIMLAIVFGGERPSPWVLVGAATVVLGVLVLLTDKDRILE